ncbi:acrylyl-CoA reductase (NADPH) [Paraburkholderia silvatlantica]|uniref:Acrylyl-CoA reductase (NADPH) n=1 Tax=Paraburkholderia silvatlantica TaxID=321895 RepID=A0A2U1ADD8_9BURK|nr:MDR family oxidoreductase [Paraburkholderia silvatlantica]MBB2926028.1 acrylyl-CoA reductase (NADPH) [Paraburkholderia silvatlantica]PVY33561.1 acrylyl-CoA reductase (NADPH) [Paraburkholderia silvatlantica]PXW38501.1 acrylyl-CoA reductase (NADPH) [Paraburkholderia silvatlantica]PYE27691.1 acrylyl-CoA reductase (NADPH) [Paraburkholderia silvatlantica]TDQ92953.1 acrylyl-CoA reductase (NADPH) [Paraburkholderia silvatlantica]
MFKAILIDKESGSYEARIAELDDARLPEGDVLVDVGYSTLNYKDGLAITGKGPVVRSFPMVPGIDFAGTVAQSANPAYAVGDAVVLNGWGVGEQHWGGLAQKARVKGDWLIPLPKGFTPRQTMAVGTAGYTAMLCILALERHGITPAHGDVLVTGASGGVGSFAIALLTHRGYRVVASTGRLKEAEYLKQLGAVEVIDRASLSEPGRPLQKERWAAAVDSVGGHTLANVCASLRADGAVAACGLAQGMDFPATVAPFILRGVSLLGINSVTRPFAQRQQAWQALGETLDLQQLDTITQEIGLAEAIAAANDLLAGHVRGRLVVDVNR